MRVRFRVEFTDSSDPEEEEFEFPTQEAFDSALKLVSWATGFFLDESFFTSEVISPEGK